MRISIARRLFVVITIVCLTGCGGGSRYNPFSWSKREVVREEALVRPSESSAPDVNLPSSGGYTDAAARSSNADQAFLPPGQSYSNASYRDTSGADNGRDWDRQRPPLSPSAGYGTDPRSGYGGVASREPVERSAALRESSLYPGVRQASPGATPGADLYQRAGTSSYLGAQSSRDSLGGYGGESGGYGQRYDSSAAASAGLTGRPDSSLGGSVQSNPYSGLATAPTPPTPLYSSTTSRPELDGSAPGYNLPQSVANSGQPTGGSELPWDRHAAAPPADRGDTLASSGLPSSSRPPYPSPDSAAGPSSATGGYEQGVYSSISPGAADTCSGESDCCPTPGGNTDFNPGGSTNAASYSSRSEPYAPGSVRPPSSSASLPLSKAAPTSYGAPSLYGQPSLYGEPSLYDAPSSYGVSAQPPSPTANPYYRR